MSSWPAIKHSCLANSMYYMCLWFWRWQLVFSTTGGMGREELVIYRRLAELLSRHDAASYNRTLAWLHSTFTLSLFIYYQFLSKTGFTQKAKPVQGASPQKLHTTYKLHIHTRPNK